MGAEEVTWGNTPSLAPSAQGARTAGKHTASGECLGFVRRTSGVCPVLRDVFSRRLCGGGHSGDGSQCAEA
jgi:hypothetical protein